MGRIMQHYTLIWEDDVLKGLVHYAVFDNEEDIVLYVKELFGEDACQYCDYINKDKTIVFCDTFGRK